MPCLALRLQRAAQCDVLLRADDIVHDDDAAGESRDRCARPSAAPSSSTRCAWPAGETVLAHVPSHHDHTIGEWIGIRPEVETTW